MKRVLGKIPVRRTRSLVPGTLRLGAEAGSANGQQPLTSSPIVTGMLRRKRRRLCAFIPATTPPRMFLNELSPEQRRALHVLARQVIDADQRLTLPEVERLDEIYQESGIGTEHADAPNAAGDLNLLFPTSRERAVVVIELMQVAYADGQLHPREEAAVQRIAAQLQIDQGLWTNIMDWAQRHAALAAEASAFGRTREATFDD